MNNNIFDEITETKEDLPKINTITNTVTNRKLNMYQIVACVTLFICFFGGIVLGNIFPACGATSNLFGTCTKTEFNISIMFFFWFCSFLVCLLFYGMGHIIELLTSIDSKIRVQKAKNK